MKRTEAIEWLEVMKENAIFEQYDALLMAIEALQSTMSQERVNHESTNDLINRADAIKELKKAYWDKNIQSAKDDPCVIDAMTDWAIRTIKALPSTEVPNGDLISRVEAMNKCKNAENELTDEAERKGLRVARFIIGELPSAEAVEGEWIKKRVDGRGIHHGFCSKCGFNVKRNYNYNYCPNCGKKMKIVERR